MVVFAFLAVGLLAQEDVKLSWESPQRTLIPGGPDLFDSRPNNASDKPLKSLDHQHKKAENTPASSRTPSVAGSSPRIALPPKRDFSALPAQPSAGNESAEGLSTQNIGEVTDATSGSGLIARTAFSDAIPPTSAARSPPISPANPKFAPAAYSPPLDPYSVGSKVRRSGFFDSPMFAMPLLGQGISDGGPMQGGSWFGPESSGNGDLVWIRGEYLGWFSDGMRTPILVTTSVAGTPRNQAAVIGEPNTRTLFGGSKINDNYQNGFRTRGGFWFSPSHALGIEADYYQLFEAKTHFAATSLNGNTIIGRPFFDITNGRETAELVSFPGLVAGTTGLNSASNFKSFGVRGRGNVCGPTDPCQAMVIDGFGRDKIEWLLGYRYANLADDLSITENLTSLLPAAPGTVAVRDSFSTENQFHGFELGAVYEASFERLWIESIAKVAIGNNRQRVSIGGSTDLTEAGITDHFNGGILAQRTNSGTFSRDELAVIPELGATLGVRITPRLSLTVGYTFVYFSNVVRAGDQIDTDLNPNLFPEEANPFTGALRPRFAFHETDFWTHGISFGGDFRF